MKFNFAVISDLHLAVDIRRRNILNVVDRVRQAFSDVSRSTMSARPKRRPGTFRSFLPATYDNVPLAAAESFLKRFNDIELLVILGDLATTGMSDDLLVAQRVVLGTGTRLGEVRLGSVCRSQWLLPGNHDRYIDNNGEPGSTLFDAFFSSVYKPTGRVNAASFAGGSIAFIAADLCLPFGKYVGDTRRWGRGLVDEVTLADIVAQTKMLKEKNPDVFVIWTVHFSPADDVADLLLLEGREKLLAAARDLDVKFVLCGHTHQNACYNSGGLPNVICAGTVSEVDAKAGHHLHVGEIDLNPPSGKASLTWFDFRFDEASREFMFTRKHVFP